ncbi:unnamed protein product [Camellia sinensis]
MEGSAIQGENEDENDKRRKATLDKLEKASEDTILGQVGEALDHIINSAAKSNYMSAGQINLYGESFLISAEVLDSSFCLPIRKAKVEKERKDVTITTFQGWLAMLLRCDVQAAEILAKEEISAEVINLCSIRPLDRATINASVWKTSRLVTVEEGFPQHGVGAEICLENFLLQRECKCLSL